MKILLMGGSGIISSEICNLSIEKGYDVTIVNRGLRKNKINKNAKLIIADLKNDSVESIREKLDINGYDVIVDFITYKCSQLKRTMEIANGLCKQFIFVSSATVYLEKDNDIPFNEKDPIGDTGWGYAHEKAICEKYIYDNYMNYKFEYTIIRPYITYGENRIPYQVIPLKYYTLINRIKCNKPIPLFGKDIKCTLTVSKDFAVAAVGLFLNKLSYGEVFNIMGNNVTTWEKVLQYICEELNIKPNIVYLDKKCLNKNKKIIGIDYEEILFDKSRNMIFDNSKIKETVKEFGDSISVKEGISESVKYYENNKNSQKIDYLWDSRVDNLLSKTKKTIDKDKLSYKAYNYKLSKDEAIQYKFARNNFIYIFYKIYMKVMRKG